MDNFIEELRKTPLKHITIGKSTAHSKDVLDIENLPFFKIPAHLYQKFDIVWHDKSNFENHINWRTILDETIRLIGKEGRIVMTIESDGKSKACEHYQAVLANIKMYLCRRVGLRCEVEYESPMIYRSHAKSQKLNDGDKIIVVFKIQRQEIDIYRDKSWSFAIITNGNKTENVIKFCKSIRDLDQNFEHEIIIVGPRNELYDNYKVRYLDDSKYRDEYAEICSKKNDIADFATNQNLLITHDRFYLANDFFSGFEKYGYDFDFLAPLIKNGNGKEETCWTLLKRNIFDRDILNFGNFFDTSSVETMNNPEIAKKSDLSYSFLSGGCLIFKKNVLRKIRFNALLFWHQIEDWEIAAQFVANGFVPKSNRFSTVINLRPANVYDVTELNNSKTFIRRIRRSIAKKFLKLAFKIHI